MLARGILCRLASDVPKTSTHDLPQLARLLQRNILSRNAATVPTLCALSRAYHAVLARSCRSYATAARATKPTRTVKKAVKKTAAKKTAPKKKAATKKSVKRTTKSKKAAPKKKTPVRKPRKAPTPEEKEKAKIKELREKALKAPSTGRAVTAYNVFVAEFIKSRKAAGAVDVQASVAAAAQEFKNFTPAEKEVSPFSRI